jgi:hypothetical protein
MKHWQFFLLTVGLPFLFQGVFVGTIFTSQRFNPAMTIYFPIVMILFMGGLIGWMFSIGFKFNSLLPEGADMKTGFYKVAVFFPVVYMLVVLFGVTGFFNVGQTVNQPNPAIFALIVPAHFFAMICMFYMLYFTSKTLKMVELQKKIGFGDYAGEFFLMWFFPVGIWILQPRINKIFGEHFEKE